MDNKKQENSTVNAHKKSPASPGILCVVYFILFYCFRVSSILSETMMIVELIRHNAVPAQNGIPKL